MWTGRAPFRALRDRDRWTVEFFAAGPPGRAASAFPLVPLRDLVDERREAIDPQAYPDHPFNYLGLEHVQSLTGDLVGFAPRPGRAVRSRSKVFRAGDVLYGRLRPYLNKVYLAEGRASCGICSGEFFVLTPRSELIRPRLLRALLASDIVLRVVSGRQTGSALPRLQRDDLLGIAVPVPPMDIQTLYENFINQESQRRRHLAAELADLAGRTMEAISRALASGEPPTPVASSPREEDGADPNPLPFPPSR